VSEPTDTTFGQGQFLFRQGEKGGELFFIKAGKVEVSVRTEGGEAAVVATVGEKSVLGTMSFLENDPRSATAKAITEVKAVVINQAQREKLLKTVPAWFAVLVKDLSSSLRRLNVEFATVKAENETLKKRLEAYKKGEKTEKVEKADDDKKK
jgi:CRP-like cAMP-binding protein